MPKMFYEEGSVNGIIRIIVSIGTSYHFYAASYLTPRAFFYIRINTHLCDVNSLKERYTQMRRKLVFTVAMVASMIGVSTSAVFPNRKLELARPVRHAAGAV